MNPFVALVRAYKIFYEYGKHIICVPQTFKKHTTEVRGEKYPGSCSILHVCNDVF